MNNEKLLKKMMTDYVLMRDLLEKKAGQKKTENYLKRFII